VDYVGGLGDQSSRRRLDMMFVGLYSFNKIQGKVAYMRPPKLLASLQAHDIAIQIE